LNWLCSVAARLHSPMPPGFEAKAGSGHTPSRATGSAHPGNRVGGNRASARLKICTGLRVSRRRTVRLSTRISPDNTVETIWRLKRRERLRPAAVGWPDCVLDGRHGRIYRLTPDGKVTLLVQTTRARRHVCFRPLVGLLAATGDLGEGVPFGTGHGNNGLF